MMSDLIQVLNRERYSFFEKGKEPKELLSLAEEYKIGCFQSYNGTYFFSKASTCMFTISFCLERKKFKDDNGNPIPSVITMITRQKEFLKKWYLKNIKGKDSEIEAWFYRFTQPFAGCLSIPAFLSEELVKDLMAGEITFYGLSPEIRNIECYLCETKFNAEKSDGVYTCPNCGKRITVKVD